MWVLSFGRGLLNAENSGTCGALRGPLDRLNDILSLLHPLDRYRTPCGLGVRLGGPISPYLASTRRQEFSTVLF